MRLRSWIPLAFVALGPPPTPAPRVPTGSGAPFPPIAFNDNRVPAGTMARGALNVSLVARPGEWRPFGADRDAVPLLVFGEVGKPLQDPGPLIRVRQGTRVRITLRNQTTDTLVVHGWSRRHPAAMDTLVVEPGQTGQATFIADVPGSFYYWASAHHENFNTRMVDDEHLSGALIVDPPGRIADDRVFVIEGYIPDLRSDGGPDRAHELLTINGRPWPFTERLTYAVGDSIRWRIINASAAMHPMHMHGFYFRVNARGDLARDTVFWPAQQRHVVTEPMWNGSTMDLAWYADRPGNWIFHCHFSPHVIPNTRLGNDTLPTAVREAELESGMPMMPGMIHANSAMGGLILGITVRPPPGWHQRNVARRTIRLLVQSDSTTSDTARRFGYVQQSGNAQPSPDSVNLPGPTLILHRGEPTRIWVINHSPETTAVHWHGLEIESYYDGVPGFSGIASTTEPAIAPGDSFEVLVTPPRSGTFIYHTHYNDFRQLTHGLYGALIVLDSGQTWNPDVDRVFLLGNGPDYLAKLNGRAHPDPLTLKTGVRYRFRLINISVTEFPAHFGIVSDRRWPPARWIPVAKDGWTLSPWQATPVPMQQDVAVGETFDFTLRMPDTLTMTLVVDRLLEGGAIRQTIRFIH